MDWTTYLAERPIGVFATVGRDGMPHAVPVALVVCDGRPAIWCRADSVKVRNAKREGRAALTAYKGNTFVSIRGAVTFIRPGERRYEEITRAHSAKYPGDQPDNDLVIEVSPDRISFRP
jgi:nitroimidazol reductase NimA-like FMN-containing flavoprotein (pyridoxamine 5'-phosphate oxidase superfamily)